MKGKNVVKIGGSVLFRDGSVDEEFASGLLKLFLENNPPKALVVGCGRHLHELVSESRLDYFPEDGKELEFIKEKLEGFFALREAVGRNLTRIRDASIEYVSKIEAVEPAKLFVTRREYRKSAVVNFIGREYMEHESTLLTSGGPVLDTRLIISAISSDTIAAALSCEYDADRLLIFSDVDGVYDEQGKILKEVDLSSPHEKISGGMKDKLRRVKPAVEKGIPVYVASGRNYDSVRNVLDGNYEKCTRVIL